MSIRMNKVVQILVICLIGLVKENLSIPWTSQAVWEDIPSTRYFKVYIFNVTNPDETTNSNFTVQPILQEVGPYVYSETYTKFNVSLNLLDESYNFKTHMKYEYLPSESNGNLETDLVNVINVPLIAFATRLSSPVDHYMTKQTFDYVYDENDGINGIITRNISVKDLIFDGIDVSRYVERETDVQETLSSGREPIPGYEPFSTGRFGVHVNTNQESSTGRFRVASKINEKGNILEWNEKSELDWWSGKSCNAIIGTDGTVFTENIETSSSLKVFTPEICRSISFDFKESVDDSGVLTSTYVLSDEVFESSYESIENACYCPGASNITMHTGCTKQGIYYAGQCKFGVPYVISEPHFLNSDSSYSESFDGLSPSENSHKTELYVEPITGTVLKSLKRFQWNVRFGPLNGKITHFNHYPETIFPLMWIEETFEISNDVRTSLHEYLVELSKPSTTEPAITIGITETTPLPIPPNDNNIQDQLYWISRNTNSIIAYLNMLTVFYFVCTLLFVLGLTYMFITLKRATQQRPNYRTMNVARGFGFNYDLEPQVIVARKN